MELDQAVPELFCHLTFRESKSVSSLQHTVLCESAMESCDDSYRKQQRGGSRWTLGPGAPAGAPAGGAQRTAGRSGTGTPRAAARSGAAPSSRTPGKPHGWRQPSTQRPPLVFTIPLGAADLGTPGLATGRMEVEAQARALCAGRRLASGPCRALGLPCRRARGRVLLSARERDLCKLTAPGPMRQTPAPTHARGPPGTGSPCGDLGRHGPRHPAWAQGPQGALKLREGH